MIKNKADAFKTAPDGAVLKNVSNESIFDISIEYYKKQISDVANIKSELIRIFDAIKTNTNISLKKINDDKYNNEIKKLIMDDIEDVLNREASYRKPPKGTFTNIETMPIINIDIQEIVQSIVSEKNILLRLYSGNAINLNTTNLIKLKENEYLLKEIGALNVDIFNLILKHYSLNGIIGHVISALNVFSNNLNEYFVGNHKSFNFSPIYFPSDVKHFISSFTESDMVTITTANDQNGSPVDTVNVQYSFFDSGQYLKIDRSKLFNVVKSLFSTSKNKDEFEELIYNSDISLSSLFGELSIANDKEVNVTIKVKLKDIVEEIHAVYEAYKKCKDGIEIDKTLQSLLLGLDTLNKLLETITNKLSTHNADSTKGNDYVGKLSELVKNTANNYIVYIKFLANEALFIFNLLRIDTCGSDTINPMSTIDNVLNNVHVIKNIVEEEIVRLHKEKYPDRKLKLINNDLNGINIFSYLKRI